VVLVADITERKKAQASLADQQRMLELLIQHTEQGIWFIDNDLRTTDANPAMCRMLGRPLAELLGLTIFDFVDEANAAIFREHVARRAQGQADSYEIALLRADGSLVHCYNNATPIFDAAGRKVGAVGMFSDISPLKRAQDQVRLTSELLAQKSRVLEVTLDSLSQGVLSADAQGRTSAYNQRFLELLKIPEPLMQTRPTLQAIREYQMAQGHIPYDAAGVGTEVWHRRPSRYQRRTIDGLVIEVQTHAASDGSLVRTSTSAGCNAPGAACRPSWTCPGRRACMPMTWRGRASSSTAAPRPACLTSWSFACAAPMAAGCGWWTTASRTSRPTAASMALWSTAGTSPSARPRRPR